MEISSVSTEWKKNNPCMKKDYLFVVEVTSSGNSQPFCTHQTIHVPHDIVQWGDLLAKLLNEMKMVKDPKATYEIQIYDKIQKSYITLINLVGHIPRIARLKLIVNYYSRDNITSSATTTTTTTTTTKNKDTNGFSKPYLLLPWKKFPLDFMQGEFQIQSQPLYIMEMPNSGKGTGLTIWDASIVLAKYLEHDNGNLVRNKNVLELGAGTGLVGLTALLLGARKLVATDLEYALDNLQSNLQRNLNSKQTEMVVVKEVDWTKTIPDLGGSIEVILASDVVWIEELIEAFVHTLACISRKQPTPPTVFLSYQYRTTSSHTLLFHFLKQYHFHVQTVLSETLHPNYSVENIHIFRIVLQNTSSHNNQ